MNARTAKLINRTAKSLGTTPRELRKVWKGLPSGDREGARKRILAVMIEEVEK